MAELRRKKTSITDNHNLRGESPQPIEYPWGESPKSREAQTVITLGGVPIHKETLSTLSDALYRYSLTTNPEEETKKIKPERKRSSPLDGALADADGPILRVFLVRKSSTVLGWFEYIDESFRKLMIYNQFNSSSNIHLYAREVPAASPETILLPGMRKDQDDKHFEVGFRSVEEAEAGLNLYLQAFEELNALVRGTTSKQKDIVTKFNQNYIHIF